MLRLVDPDTARLVDVLPARRLRICIHQPGDGGVLTLGNLRVLLVGDILRRVVQMQDTQALVAVITAKADADADADAVADADADLLGIQPPMVLAASTSEVSAGLLGAADICVLDPATADAPCPAAVRVAVGPVLSDATNLVSLTRGRCEPLAVRLDLLTHHYSEPAELTPTTVAAAQNTLERFRSQLAQWATAPSKPIDADAMREAQSGFDDDLDLSRALDLIRGLKSDNATADGRKFETAAYLDRVLGLDLALYVGTLRA